MKYISLFIFLILSPFLFSILQNEYYLFLLSQEMKKVEAIILRETNHRLNEKARGSRVFVNNNGNDCTYRIVKVYDAFLSPKQEENITKILQKISIKASRSTTKYKEARISFSFLPLSTLFLELRDGPYSGGLDFRCW